MSISKAINTQEAPVKEKHARRIILGTHHEKGAFTFWSYAIGLPLPSSSILSWKFCHVLHKVLRDGHPNVLQDCQRYRSNIRETGDLWGHLHDRYGQLVNIYTKLLLTKISFHLKHPEFPSGLEVTDEVLEKAAGTDVNNIFQLTVEMFDYMDCELRLTESVFRQLNTAMAVSQMSAVQCRLAPLIQVIQDCSHLYHYTVKLMFKLHSCLPADTLQGHRDRFHEQFRSLKNFFKKASDMLYFKRLIQIPRLPESPPNFLRASALAEHVKPVVVIPEEAPEDEEPENLIEISTAPPVEQQNVPDIFEQTFGPPNGVRDDRDLQIENLKKEVDLLRAELEKIKLEAQRYITQLKAQINSLEAELEEQRKQKQKALVDNEQLRDEVERLQRAQLESSQTQGLYIEAENYLISRVQAALESVNTLENGHAKYITNMTDATELVGALAQFAHLTADTIVNGSATSHLAPTDHADKLTESCRDCGHRSLEYLNELKDRQLLRQANPEDVRRTLQGILQLGQELRPKSLDIKQEELGDMVDKEMASTSAAIEDAVRRIEDMMNQARNKSSGVKLEVNERILNSCTDLMKAIRLLVMTSTNLQKEIVEGGRGAATTQEFYAKNSRWTEGLISASKAVGWGATQLVESADKVVLHTGKYEELIVCSHEIAASTAQLVAASKVKADKNSRNLGKLQECSRSVNEMAANVVASTKSGQEQIEDKDTMDFSGMSLIKLKKEEMETQVKVLELEKRLENERIRLGELRKKHYALAGVYEDPAEGEGKPAMAPKQGILKKPPLAQKPAYPLKQDCEVFSLIHSPTAVLTKPGNTVGGCLIYPWFT
ncbi:huntingtin-interacting protein 1-related protein isoform X3 [Emydura macquarii macquarii]|uniref:huntingtin-interacting protein 1-related protein isoform X3 n=1 Tax=Emydura macquarii macquarii TaxID=1129001 RepID=UPI00352B4806